MLMTMTEMHTERNIDLGNRSIDVKKLEVTEKSPPASISLHLPKTHTPLKNKTKEKKQTKAIFYRFRLPNFSIVTNS